MDKTKLELAQSLKLKNPKLLNMVLGFDGFVDEIIHVVDKRQNSESFTRINTISNLAQRIDKASGLSTNIELVNQVTKIGGNGPIMCNALSKHEANITYIGALGYPQIHEVFREMESNAKLYSIAESGHTDALEFLDGKLMFGKMTSLKDVNYERLIDSISKEKLIQLLDDADLFAAVNWSMLPNMTSLFKKIISDILPLLKQKEKLPIMFVDLADPEKRESAEIKEMIDLLKSFNSHFRVILGLNKKEAYDVAAVLGLIPNQHENISLGSLNQLLYDYTKIHGIVIHPVDQSCTIINHEFALEKGPLCANPKLTTGAGDNFNSGFILGLLLDQNPSHSLLMGMATSGYYVRNAKSPNYKELIQFIENWALNQID